ncbi:glycosyl-transferase for dystroglycan-domain-containing protein [Gongronella butleri]|nr:glycosyl-transferase for dystroglycan-domain-containing protein [Gongronella butleri]
MEISYRKAARVWIGVCVAILLLLWTIDFTQHHAAPTNWSFFTQNKAAVPLDDSHKLTLSSQQLSIAKNKMSWLDDANQAHQIDKTLLQEKLFASSAGSHDIQPYFYKATSEPANNAITITTTITRSRIPTLARLANRYRGPISVALHISPDQQGQEALALLAEAYAEWPAMREFVDVHIIRDKMERQMNLWRNVARFYARSKYVMMLDVDFHLCTDVSYNVASNPEALAVLEAGHALVIPAFEYTKQQDGLDSRWFPTDKRKLAELHDAQAIDMFHAFWRPGHDSTDYDHWFKADQLYPVTAYQQSYEPYVIYKRDGHPWCDERFFGYGSNKAACLYEMYASGVDFYVLPHDFIIHQTHDYPTEARDQERFYNRRLYTAFREEVCFRYARKFIAQGQWTTAVTRNLMGLCDKIPRFHSFIASA